MITFGEWIDRRDSVHKALGLSEHDVIVTDQIITEGRRAIEVWGVEFRGAVPDNWFKNWLGYYFPNDYEKQDLLYSLVEVFDSEEEVTK